MRLTAAKDSPIHIEGDARLDFVPDGKMCNMKFLDDDIKSQLASVSAIVDKGNIIVFGSQESYIVHGEHEYWSEDSDKQKAWRVCGTAGRKSGNEIDEDGEV